MRYLRVGGVLGVEHHVHAAVRPPEEDVLVALARPQALEQRRGPARSNIAGILGECNPDAIKNVAGYVMTR